MARAVLMSGQHCAVDSVEHYMVVACAGVVSIAAAGVVAARHSAPPAIFVAQ